MTLFHYCCDHSLQGILRDGVVRPMVKVPHLNYANVAWFADLKVPDRDGLGLTSETLQCDRTEWRVTVDYGDAEPWGQWAHRNRIDPDVREALESYGWPGHWFISEVPLRVVAVVCSSASAVLS